MIVKFEGMCVSGSEYAITLGNIMESKNVTER